MNVSLHKISLLAFFGLLVPLLSWGQETTELTTFRDQAVSHTFQSIPNAPSHIQGPANGTYTLTSEGGFAHTLEYTPNSGFVGVDEIMIAVWTSATSWEFWTFSITVIAAEVIAVHDYVTVLAGQSVDIPVLDNDVSSSGTKLLSNITLVNNGIAEIVPSTSSVRFTPRPGFSGTAYLNYVICDGIETCDLGTVSISVLDISASQDTLEVFTKKNTPQIILLPNTYALIEGPYQGIYDALTKAYTPDQDFTGIDYLTFEMGTLERIVKIHVLELTPTQENQIVQNDKYYLTPDQTIEFNVLTNDLYGLSSGCFGVVNTPLHGSVSVNPFIKGQMTYTPRPGFTGVDFFTYTARPPFCAGEPEYATVYIFVSNFEPAKAKFIMTTPKRTPLVINPEMPIENYDFMVDEQGDLGEVLLLSGDVDTIIYGEEIEGRDLIVYVPDFNVNSGTDEFELTYCVLDYNNECSFEKGVKIEINILDLNNNQPFCIDDCIWPGDTNFDGEVNIDDLLPLGLEMGAIGTVRTDATMSDWYGQYGDDWGTKLGGETGIDLKHLDSDGDSIVTALDTLAINRFYGNTHAIIASDVPFLEYNIQVKGNFVIAPGELVELELVLGNDETPAIDVYGFTFPFEYPTQIIKEGSVGVFFDEDSWLTYNSPVLHMTKDNGQGLLEAGFTRTSGMKASGKGIIATTKFVVEDDIEGFRPGDSEIKIPMGGQSVKLMSSNGQMYNVAIEPFELTLVFPTEEEEEEIELTNDLLKVYPNPATDILTVHLNGQKEFEGIAVYNMMGQKVEDFSNLNTNHYRINVNNWKSGVYVVNVFTNEGMINQKIEILR